MCLCECVSEANISFFVVVFFALLLLLLLQEKALGGALVNVLRETDQNVPDELLKFGGGVKRKEHKMYGNHFKSAEDGGAPLKASSHITFDDE